VEAAMSAWRQLLGRMAIGKTAAVTGPIGLDFAAEELHMMQLQYRADGPAIIAAVSVRYPSDRASLMANPAQFKSFIRAALKSRPFRGRIVVTCLPAEDVKILVVTYRQEAEKKPDDVILRAVRERLGELTDSLVDFVQIRNPVENAGEQDALVAVAKRTQVMAYLERLRNAGLEAAALDVRPVALCRLAAAVQPEETPYRNVLLANFGVNKTYLTVLSGKRLMLDREIEFGEAQLVATLAKTLAMPEAAALKLLQTAGASRPQNAPDAKSLDPDEDARRTLGEVLRPRFTMLSQEINKTMAYMAGKMRGASIECIYLMGSVAFYPNAIPWIQGFFANRVEVLDPFAAFAARSDAAVLPDSDPSAGMVLAAGLALRRPERG
jgi:Tfp pilus assembly PilM family ATPase